MYSKELTQCDKSISNTYVNLKISHSLKYYLSGALIVSVYFSCFFAYVYYYV